MISFIKTFVMNRMKENTYVLWNQRGDCVLIDPGCETVTEQQQLADFFSLKKLRPMAVLLTHGHFDHAVGISFLYDHYCCESWIHPADQAELKQSGTMARLYGMKLRRNFRARYELEDLAELTFGEFHLKVLHVPGHTAGSVCFYETQSHCLFAGDTLMKGSLGFSNSGYRELLVLLKEKVFSLPGDTVVFCGHGPATILEEEKKNNLFFRKMQDEMPNH
jgi:glyoxylase-like metal-dependent hydrolase (beta-lactamase superfamily II)